jgi:hypothetical protein
MRNEPITFAGSSLYAFIVFVGCIAVVVFLNVEFPEVYSALPTFAQGMSVFAVFGVIVAFLEYRRKIAFERADMAIQFMLRFYENDKLDDFRKALRDQDEEYSARTNDNSMKNEVVLAMNFFEALAIAVEQGCFDLQLVDKMLGAVICELGDHKIGKELKEAGYSYEVFYGVLLPQIRQIHK